MDIAALVSTVGFPIALVLVMGAYLKDLMDRNYKDFTSREEKLIAANKHFAKVLEDSSRRLRDTLDQHEELDRRMDVSEGKMDKIEEKIDGIDSKVDVIKDNLEDIVVDAKKIHILYEDMIN